MPSSHTPCSLHTAASLRGHASTQLVPKYPALQSLQEVAGSKKLTQVQLPSPLSPSLQLP